MRLGDLSWCVKQKRGLKLVRSSQELCEAFLKSKLN